MVDIHSPIIIIGAGRSGSTLLHRMLNQHPEVVLFNENSFLAPRLWLELWNDRFWFTSQRFVAQQPRSAVDSQPAIEPELLAREQRRIGALIAHLIASVHQLDQSASAVWGYKEIWNGSSQFDYPWEDYDSIFPGAFWLHLVRNPFQFAKSTAHWNRDPLTPGYLRERLVDWVAMLQRSTQRTTAKRYHQIRFEDLLDDPKTCLMPVFESNGLSWHDACFQALKRFSMKSVGTATEHDETVCDRDQLIALTREVHGLEDWMDQLHYSVPDRFETLIEAPRSNQQRTSFAELNLIAESENDSRKHRPQHLMQQLLHQTITDLKQEWSEDSGRLHKEMQDQAAQWQEKCQREHDAGQAEHQQYLTAHNKYLSEHDKFLRERENFLNERKRHFIYYFFVRRYHTLRALFGKM